LSFIKTVGGSISESGGGSIFSISGECCRPVNWPTFSTVNIQQLPQWVRGLSSLFNTINPINQLSRPVCQANGFQTPGSCLELMNYGGVCILVVILVVLIQVGALPMLDRVAMADVKSELMASCFRNGTR
jgi:hypothetical protein